MTQEINQTIFYPTRFVRVDGRVISDRSYNVKAIAEATMGRQSVLDCRLVGKDVNIMTTTIRPYEGSAGVFVVNLRTLFRQVQKGPFQKAIVEGLGADNAVSITGQELEGFYTSEMVRQEIRLDTNDLKVMPMIREVETTTLFVMKDGMQDQLSAWQKTCSYLTKSDLKYVDTKGRPVDVRWYQLKYSRRRR